MNADLIAKMRDASSKEEPMVPRTLRLPKDLDREILALADREGIPRAIIYRTLIELGWKELNG